MTELSELLANKLVVAGVSGLHVRQIEFDAEGIVRDLAAGAQKVSTIKLPALLSQTGYPYPDSNA